MSEKKDKKPTPSWASREVLKRRRRFEKEGRWAARHEPSGRELEDARYWRENPDEFREEFELLSDKRRKEFDRLCSVQPGDPDFDKRIRVGDEVSPKGQQMVNDWWAEYAAHFGKQGDKPPQITLGYDIDIDTAAVIPSHGDRYIHLSDQHPFKKALEGALPNTWEGQYLPRTLAHEMAHLFNGDATYESDYERACNPDNEKYEILADRLGAIIFGNPRQYYEALLAKVDSEVERNMQSDPPDEQERLLGFEMSREYPSAIRDLDMQRRWAEILEKAEVKDPETGGMRKITDKDGNITDKEAALEMYEKAKNFTTALVDVKDQARYGIYRENEGASR